MKPPRNINGAFNVRPLELAAWLSIATLAAAVLLIPRASDFHAASSMSETWRMDLNAAPIEELMTLPGMTSRRAKAIVTAREKRGGFEHAADIASVPGMTNDYVKRIESMVETRHVVNNPLSPRERADEQPYRSRGEGQR